MKLYKNKYLIGIYAPVEEGETLLGLCDNSHEFAELLGININESRVLLSRLFNKQRQGLYFYGKLCSVEFIEESYH